VTSVAVVLAGRDDRHADSALDVYGLK